MIRKEVMSVIGNEPIDIGIINGNLINVYSDEVMENTFIGIKGKKIVYAGKFDKYLADKSVKIIDARNKFVSPGFIETHTHIAQMSMLCDFAEVSLLSGTTTVITESAEFANSGGAEAVRQLLKDVSMQPLKLFIVLPPLTPPFPEFETSIGLNSEEYKELLKHEKVLGLGEFYWSRILDFKPFYEDLIEYTLSIGKTVHGHSAGAKDKKLNAYVSMGIKSCHEPITVKEVIDRIRLGLHVILREGSVRCDFSNVYGFKKVLKDYRMISVSTDGATPLLLKEKGTLNEIARKAVRYGFSALEAIKLLTINAAYVFNLHDKTGAVAPGKCADLVLFDDIDEFKVNTVIVDGSIKIEGSKPAYIKRKFSYPHTLKQSVKVNRVSEKDFEYFSNNKTERVRCLKYLEFLLTDIEEINLKVTDNNIKAAPEFGILKHLVFERYGSGRVAKGFIKDLGFTNFTYAGTLNWEANQLVAIGADEIELAIAVNRILELQGGMVLVGKREIVEEIPLPVCGVMSELPLEILAEKEYNFNKLLHSDGCRMANPFLWLQTLSFTGLPFFKLTDKGIVNVKKNKIINLIAENCDGK